MSDAVKRALEKISEQVAEQGDAVEEIVLNLVQFGKFENEIKEALEKHKDTITILSLNECGLTSLDNFPDLPNLERIELTGNKLSGDHLKPLSGFHKLASLVLGSNPISGYEELQSIESLPELMQLDLVGCPITEKSDYREKVFSTLKKLEILDNTDKDGEEVDYEDSDEEGGDGEGGEEGGEGEGEADEDGEEDDEEEGDEPAEQPEYEDVDGQQVVKKKLKTE